MAHPFNATDPAPILKTFGDIAGHIAALLRQEPALALRLVFGPPRALHATAIYLHSVVQNVPPATVAATLLREHPKSLLRHALPDAPPTLYRLLDRAVMPTWGAEDYASLSEVWASPVADILPRQARVTPQAVRDAAAILRGHPVVMRARHAVAQGYQRDALTTVVTVMERIELLDRLNTLPDGIGARGLARRVASDFGNAEAPSIDFPVPPGWMRVTRVGDLWAHGRRLHLCLRPGYWGAGDYAVSLLMGRSVYLYHAQADVLAQFRAMPCGLWTLAQCAGTRNSTPPTDLVNALTDHVAQAGITLVPVGLGEALDRLLDPMRRRHGAGDGLRDDGEDDAGDDLAA